MATYSLVDNQNLFAGTIETTQINIWIRQYRQRGVFKTPPNIPNIQDYATALGYKSIQIINPPTPTPVVGCWKWCNNTWKLNDDPNTFPTDLVLSLRQKAYKKETDGLKLDADYNAILNNTTPDYTLWMAEKLRIRNNYPIPECCNN